MIEKLTQLDEPGHYIDNNDKRFEKNKRALARLHGGIRIVISFLDAAIYSCLRVAREHNVNGETASCNTESQMYRDADGEAWDHASVFDHGPKKSGGKFLKVERRERDCMLTQIVPTLQEDWTTKIESKGKSDQSFPMDAPL